MLIPPLGEKVIFVEPKISELKNLSVEKQTIVTCSKKVAVFENTFLVVGDNFDNFAIQSHS